jgi:flavin-dependent dehydrogenase
MRVGEQVNASIFDILEYMGITKNDFDNETFLPAFDSLAAWGNSNVSSRHSIFSTQHDSYQLDRENFDLLLLKKVSESGATVLPRTKALEFSFENGFWEVYWSIKSKAHSK